MVGFLVVVLCGAIGAEEEGAVKTIFVSPGGKDGAVGTWVEPLGKLSAALAKVMPGERVVVLEGSYGETVTLPKSGEPGKPILLLAEGRVIINPGGDKKDHGHGIVGRDVGWWIIEGFEITGHLQGIKFKNGHDITVRKCRIRAGGSGLALEGTTARNLLFEDIELFEHKSGGLDVAKPVAMEAVTFRRCIAHHNDCEDGSDGFGISHECTTRNVLFEGCQAFYNGSDGFDLSGRKGFGLEVVGCVAHHNGQKRWGANFKCWNPGSKFINCTAWVTGADADGNFELIGDNIELINCTSGANADAGIVVSGKNARIVNCIIADAAKKALVLKKPEASCTAENCLVSHCGSPGAIVPGKYGNLIGDAAFLDPEKGDYRTRRESAAVGKGQPVPEVASDADGHPRPKAAPTIGAYEPRDLDR